MKHLFSKSSKLERIMYIVTLITVLIAFYLVILPKLMCPLCRGITKWDEPYLWSLSTGAVVLLSPYVLAQEDSQWEYKGLLQQSFPSRHLAYVRLPAHASTPPRFCSYHSRCGFSNRELLITILNSDSFSITYAVDVQHANPVNNLKSDTTLTPSFNPELDCWEMEVRW